MKTSLNKILFEETIKEGRLIKNKHIYVYHKDSRNKETLHYGIGVSKKNGNAPYRNLQRRKVRPIINEFQDLILGTNIVFIIKPTFKKLSYDDRRNILFEIISKINKNATKK